MQDDWKKRAYADLAAAVQNGKEDRVRALLKQGLDPYYAPEGMEALFIMAVGNNRHGIVQAFLEQDIDPNRFRDKSGRTVLEIACLNRANDMAGMLLDAGANPNIPIGDDGFSLMHYVVSADNAELTLKMMKTGVDMDALGPSGQTVESYAAPKAREAILEFHAMKATKRLHNVYHRLRRATP